ncbi:MAG: hypothetical protein U9Q83_05180 [Bacteroidota bacterium]|nr:hypothetical protein [Bacteroidota bacterium]
MQTNNPFKNIESHEKVPETLKKKVLTTVNAVQLLMDIAELFSIKITETIGDLLLTEKNKKK